MGCWLRRPEGRGKESSVPNPLSRDPPVASALNLGATRRSRKRGFGTKSSFSRPSSHPWVFAKAIEGTLISRPQRLMTCQHTQSQRLRVLYNQTKKMNPLCRTEPSLRRSSRHPSSTTFAEVRDQVSVCCQHSSSSPPGLPAGCANGCGCRVCEQTPLVCEVCGRDSASAFPAEFVYRRALTAA